MFKILTILLDSEVYPPNDSDINEKGPLHIAAENGSLDCVVALAKYAFFGSCVSKREAQGMSPLHLAASNKHAQVMMA